MTFEQQKYQGVDVSLEESLLEYGFVLSEKPDEDGSYFAIYLLGDAVFEESSYGRGFVSEEDLNCLLRGDDWASQSDLDGMAQYADIQDMSEYITTASVVQKVSIISGYWGWVNLLGEDYHPISKSRAMQIVGID